MSFLTTMIPSFKSQVSAVGSSLKETASNFLEIAKKNPMSACRLAVVGILFTTAIIQIPFTDFVEDKDLRARMATITAFTGLLGAAVLLNSEKKIQEREASSEKPKTKMVWTNTDSDEYIKAAIELKKASLTGPDTRDTIFVVLPHLDENQAFSLKIRENRDNWDRVINKYQVEWIRAENKSEIPQIMKHLKDIKHLWIQVHGEEDSMEFSDDFDGTLTSTEIHEDLFPNLDPKAHILLSSCSTGTKNGIGSAFAKIFPEATVLAPNQAYTNEMIYFSNNKPYFLTLNDVGDACTSRCVNEEC